MKPRLSPHLFVWIARLLAAWLIVGVAQTAETPRGTNYNLIFVSLTNTRADHLGAYGYRRDTSPNLDRFAKQCLVFRNAFSHASWTLPVSMSLFTSQYPFTHGLMNREEFTPLPEQTPTFVDVLRTNGYLTAAFVGDRDYSQRFGHTARFGYVFDAANTAAQEDWRSYGVLEQTLPPARAWLRQHKDERFFMLVQAYDCHCPHAVPAANARFDPDYKGNIDFTKCYWTFEPSKPVKMRTPTGEYQQVYLLKTRPKDGDNYEVMFYPDDVKHMIALYDGEIFNADAMIGGLLDDVAALGLERNTIVVFYSDHGDMFGKHGRFMRGGPLRGTFYDDVLHVPLLIRHPALPAKSIDGLAQVIDIGPTLLDLLGFPIPPSFTGKSLKPLVTGGSAVNTHVFAGAAFMPSEKNPFFHRNSVILSVRSQQWKLILERVDNPTGPQDTAELYDLRNDPNELLNVTKQHPAELQDLKNALARWLKDTKAEKFLPGSP